MARDVVRIGAVADVHYGRETGTSLRPLFEQAAQRVDVLLLGGDLTDFGLPEEAQALARDLAATVRVPVVAVLGNHDFESGREQEVAAVMRAAGVHVLDGDSCEVCGVGIVGVKGLGAGLGRGTLEPSGPAAGNQSVHGAPAEPAKLARAPGRP